mmetsp:Transcript_1251/g.2735  ORF Transcript_1251/g.2735 Transcript_1251/m.2735 type:complete len:80 (-) Transcript_1251:1526-1765(-)
MGAACKLIVLADLWVPPLYLSSSKGHCLDFTTHVEVCLCVVQRFFNSASVPTNEHTIGFYGMTLDVISFDIVLTGTSLE